jgi:hypothetical protein
MGLRGTGPDKRNLSAASSAASTFPTGVKPHGFSAAGTPRRHSLLANRLLDLKLRGRILVECSLKYTRTRDSGTVELDGEKGFEQASRVWEKLLKLVEEDGLTRMFVVDNMINLLTEHHVFELGKWLDESRFPRGVKVAVVDPGRLDPGNMNAFMEIVVFNRGYYNIRVFSCREEARSWLEAGEQDPADP